MTAELRADVCVVGCGPAGITLARCLVAAGADVLVLESGHLTFDPDAQSMLDGTAEGPVIKDFAGYLRDARRCQVGGAGGSWGDGPRPWLMPFCAEDFERRDWIAHSGWPVTDAGLAGYTRSAASALSIGPPGGSLALTALLQARAYHFPARADALRADFLRLRSAGNFGVKLGCTAARIVICDGDVKAISAVCGGTELRVRADRFVLAAGGIENGRLLLLAVDKHGRVAPLARRPALGRFFMEHFHVVAGRVWVPASQSWLPYLTSRTGGHPGEPGPPGQETLQVLQLSAATRRRERLLGATAQLAPRTRDSAGGPVVSDGLVECDLFVRAEQAPNPDSRVSLRQARDMFGRPRAHLCWLPAAQDWTSIVRTADLTLSELRRAFAIRGALLVREDAPWPQRPASPSWSDRPTWGHHHMGTTRMHTDPDQAVVDRDGRVLGTRNLYVAGSSVFTTSSFANPTFMIVALSIRLADHLRATM